MNRLLVFATAVLFGTMLFALRIHSIAPASGAQALATAPAPITIGRPRRALDETVLERDASGQFSLVGEVNGQEVKFLVDTGADTVALTVADAQQLGLEVDPSSFVPIGRTASGVGYGAPVRLDRVAIGGVQFEDVDAVVMDGLHTNLLGQSVLRRLGRVELRGDSMVIHPPS
jgi:aspartyl protease family protein